MAPAGTGRLGELAGLFVRLGVTAFGGPAAHIAMMHDEVVRRRGWVDDQRFLDMVGATNLVPGPNSTELAIHLGHERAGWRGMAVAGVSFIVPAALIVLALAWVYSRYGATPSGQALLYGVKPVIIAIVVQALVKLGRAALTSWALWAVAVLAFALYLAGVHELLLLAGGAIVIGGVAGLRAARGHNLMLALPALPLLAQVPPGAVPVDLLRLFGVFLRAGAVLYGSGYVLLALLQRDLVVRLGWLTPDQLLDAVAIGQATPGPVSSTATLIGYVLAGAPGAFLATVGIFLPSFVFVGALSWLVPRVRDRAWTAALLDGVNASALGLMGGVGLQLGADALVDPVTVAIAVATGLLLWRTRLNSAWLVLGGAVVGLLSRLA